MGMEGVHGHGETVGFMTEFDDLAFEWVRVVSGISQGSVMGPVLFNIFINYNDVAITSKLSIFSNDTKHCREINTMQGVTVLQADLNKVGGLSWQVRLNDGGGYTLIVLFNFCLS